MHGFLIPLGMMGFILYEYDTGRKARLANQGLLLELRKTIGFLLLILSVSIFVGMFSALLCSPLSNSIWPLVWDIPSVRVSGISFAVGFATIPMLKSTKLISMLLKKLQFGIDDTNTTDRHEVSFFRLFSIWWNS